jgi:hypothetical protein
MRVGLLLRVWTLGNVLKELKLHVGCVVRCPLLSRSGRMLVVCQSGRAK